MEFKLLILCIIISVLIIPLVFGVYNFNFSNQIENQEEDHFKIIEVKQGKMKLQELNSKIKREFLLCSYCLLVGAILHELGHMFILFFYNKGKKPIKVTFEMQNIKKYTLKTGIEEDYKHLNKEELMNVYLMGMFAGIIPIIALLMFTQSYGVLIVLILYAIGCMSDFTKVVRLSKHVGN